jgi:hypothetical protein
MSVVVSPAPSSVSECSLPLSMENPLYGVPPDAARSIVTSTVLPLLAASVSAHESVQALAADVQGPDPAPPLETANRVTLDANAEAGARAIAAAAAANVRASRATRAGGNLRTIARPH